MRAAVIMSIYKNDNIKFVKEALNSLYNQSKKADVFIKIDGAVDRELEEFLTREKEKGKILYLDKREENKGLAYSLNELIKEVLNRGYDYVFRMDADDICNPLRFEKQINFMEKNRDVDICGTYIKEFGEDIEYEKVVKYPLTHKEMYEFFKKRVPVAHVSVCFKRSFFEKAGFYPVKGHITNEDTLLWLEGFKKGCVFGNIDYIGVNVRVNKSFFKRRSGAKKVWYDFKNRIKVTRELSYGIKGYFYAAAGAVINTLPSFLKKIAYKILR